MTATPAVLRATQTCGGRLREGFVVLATDVAAFIPTSGWRSVVLEVALGLVTTRIELSRAELEVVGSPTLAADLEELVCAREGFMLGADWTWTHLQLLHHRYVMLNLDGNTLRFELPPPETLARWRKLDPPSRRSQRIAAAGVAGVAVLCALVGTLAWQLTGEADYLVAGLSFAGLFVLVLAVVLYSFHQAARQL